MRLTSLSHGAGCGCKIGAAQLAPIVATLRVPDDPRVLASAAGADDAGVVQLTDDLALVHTADFFTPIVDDPYDFGRIAATNALSDIYAMGGTPVSALNLVAWPADQLELLPDVLRGGADVCAAAGCLLVGGHTIDDPEPKYGLSVTGTVSPSALLRNSGAHVGDSLWLTKPLGAGAVATAVKRGGIEEGVLAAAVSVMCTLNAEASVAARAAGASALTDVTGFGLLGHAHELAAASGLAVELDAATVPAIEGVAPLLGVAVAGGARRNREHAESFTDFGATDEPTRWLLCDPMTSGGLLAALPPGAEIPGWRIGRVVAGPPGTVLVA